MFTEVEIEAIKSACYFRGNCGWGLPDGRMTPEGALAKARGATFEETNSYLLNPPRVLVVVGTDALRIATRAWKDLCQFLNLPYPTKLTQEHVTQLVEKHQQRDRLAAPSPATARKWI